MKKILITIPAFVLLFSFNQLLAATTDRMCTMQYDPVCGVDGVTYGNSCMAGDVKISHKGECDSTTTNPKNDIVCNDIYSPVCGLVQIQCIKAPCNPIFETFSNKCTLSSNSLAKFAYNGECKNKISGPSQIKYYINIKKYGGDLFGDKLEKISGPSQIRYYTNIRKIGNKDLYGIRKPQIMAKIDVNGAYNSLLALNSECSTNGQTITPETVYNENVDKSDVTDTVITFAGTTTKPNCEFSCTYYLNTQKVVPNYNCK